MPFSPSIPIRKEVTSPMQASKWLKCPVLIDEHEMRQFISDLGDFWIILASGVISRESGSLSKEEFINYYAEYVNSLKEERIPTENQFRTIFSSVWTVSTDCVYAVHVGDQQQLIKVTKPVIQLQPHRFHYSFDDGKFRSMVFGIDSISWGIQFSYPQIYQDSSLQVQQVKEIPDFPNTALFKKIQRWMRQHTIATPFLVDGKRTNVPIRLGKECLSWINKHPQLVSKGLKVVN